MRYLDHYIKQFIQYAEWVGCFKFWLIKGALKFTLNITFLLIHIYPLEARKSVEQYS